MTRIQYFGMMWMIIAIAHGESVSRDIKNDISDVVCASYPCTIDCTAASSCQGDISCPLDGTGDCTINLIGSDAAKTSSIYTHLSANITINAYGTYSLYGSTIHAYTQIGAKLHLNIQAKQALRYSTIYAPYGEDSELSITCGDDTADGNYCSNLKVFEDYSTNIRLNSYSAFSFLSTEIRNIFDTEYNTAFTITKDATINPNYRGSVKLYANQRNNAFQSLQYYGADHGSWWIYSEGTNGFLDAVIDAHHSFITTEYHTIAVVCSATEIESIANLKLYGAQNNVNIELTGWGKQGFFYTKTETFQLICETSLDALIINKLTLLSSANSAFERNSIQINTDIRDISIVGDVGSYQSMQYMNLNVEGKVINDVIMDFKEFGAISDSYLFFNEIGGDFKITTGGDTSATLILNLAEISVSGGVGGNVMFTSKTKQAFRKTKINIGDIGGDLVLKDESIGGYSFQSAAITINNVLGKTEFSGTSTSGFDFYFSKIKVVNAADIIKYYGNSKSTFYQSSNIYGNGVQSVDITIDSGANALYSSDWDCRSCDEFTLNCNNDADCGSLIEIYCPQNNLNDKCNIICSKDSECHDIDIFTTNGYCNDVRMYCLDELTNACKMKNSRVFCTTSTSNNYGDITTSYCKMVQDSSNNDEWICEDYKTSLCSNSCTPEPTANPIIPTYAPTTAVPTAYAPTSAPTTSVPITSAPTSVPTSSVPTTSAPTQSSAPTQHTEAPTTAPTSSPTISNSHIWIQIDICDDTFDDFDFGLLFMGEYTVTEFHITRSNCYFDETEYRFNCFFHNSDFIGDLTTITIEQSTSNLWCFNGMIVNVAESVAIYNDTNCPWSDVSKCDEWSKFSEALDADYNRTQFSEYNLTKQINEGIILSSQCDYAFYERDDGKYIQCFDDVFTLYTTKQRKQLGITLHSCGLKDSGMDSGSIRHLNLNIIGKERADQNSDSDWISLDESIPLSHFPRSLVQSGRVHWENIGDLVHSNAQIPVFDIDTSVTPKVDALALYSQFEGILVGIKYVVRELITSSGLQVELSEMDSVLLNGFNIRHSDADYEAITYAYQSETDPSVYISTTSNDVTHFYIDPHSPMYFWLHYAEEISVKVDIFFILRRCTWKEYIGKEIDRTDKDDLESEFTLNEAQRECGKLGDVCYGISFDNGEPHGRFFDMRMDSNFIDEETDEISYVKVCEPNVRYEMPYASVGNGIFCYHCGVGIHDVSMFEFPFDKFGIGFNYVEASLPWYDMNERCKDLLGSQLASVHGEDQRLCAKMVKTKEKAWIGLNSRNNPSETALNNFEYVDGTTFKPFVDLEYVGGLMENDCVAAISKMDDDKGHSVGAGVYDCLADDDTFTITEALCDSYGWPADEYRTFIVNTDAQINEISTISLAVDSMQNNSICIDSAQVNTETEFNKEGESAWIPNHWVGNCPQCSSAIYFFFKYPVCEVEVLNIQMDMDNAESISSKETYSGFKCDNYNRFQESQCNVEQTMEVATEISTSISHSKESSWSLAKATKFEFQWSSTFEASAKVGRRLLAGLEWSHTFGFTVGEEITHTNGESYTNSKEDGVSYSSTDTVSCSASIDVGMGHSQSYNLAVERVNSTIPTTQDICLTLCDEYLPNDESGSEKKLYFNNVPGEIVYSIGTSCQVQFLSPIPLLNDIACDEEQGLSFLEQDIWVPLCNEADTSLYDGCQCVIGDKLTESACACVDESGNPIKDGKSVVVDASFGWENTCRVMECLDSVYTGQAIVAADTVGGSSNILNEIASAKTEPDAPMDGMYGYAPKDWIYIVLAAIFVGAVALRTITNIYVMLFVKTRQKTKYHKCDDENDTDIDFV